MKIINPITYNYFDKKEKQKKNTKNTIENFITNISNMSIYFIDIDCYGFEIKLKNINSDVKILESNKDNVDKFCNDEEKEIFFKTLEAIKSRIKYINKALENNYDTIIAKKINSVNTMKKFYFTLYFNGIDYKYNQNILDFNFIDSINIKNLSKDGIESFLKLYYSKIKFNNNYVNNNIDNNLSHINMNDIKFFNSLKFNRR